MMQRSVSGNQHVGCNALIVSGLRHKQYSKDNYDDLTFCATSTEGGLALSKSHTDGSLIRVFRSSKLNSIYRANESICGETCSCGCCVLNGFAFKKRYKSNVYRYDGLYKIDKTEKASIPGQPVFIFCITKL